MQLGCEDGAKTVVIKLEKGESVIPALESACAKAGVEQGMVLMGIGMLVDSQIGYYDGKEYKKKVLKGPRELVSLQGSLAQVDGKPSLHLHATLAGHDHSAEGGHLFEGTVGALAEITVLGLKDVRLTRVKNPGTGLSELTIQPPPGG